MSNYLINIKELVIFYIKVNYEDYLKENKLKIIEESKIKSIVSEMFDSKKDHIQEFVKTALKDILKDEYPGDSTINKIFSEILADKDFCVNKVFIEIKAYQETLKNKEKKND
mgnify:CR=1 FL=1|tara:strand:+ start:1777 stop:2112 length:336 start_codon:yes stop_codon:yes gene_type:complete